MWARIPKNTPSLGPVSYGDKLSLFYNPTKLKKFIKKMIKYDTFPFQLKIFLDINHKSIKAILQSKIPFVF